ncbi:hypothetical protein [Niveispirillum sp. KHB5.9]|uniref:hypothetical protein n=1 Tax=Niveispirillum sp. KHB5.9 TaxID=3400269 RepID=UPI003A83FC40
MQVSGFPGRKALLLAASLSALLLVSGCGDPQAEANKRVVEAAQTLSTLTEKTSAAERVAALEKAEKLLASIPAELAETSVAVDIVAGKPVGGHRLADIRVTLVVARRLAAQEKCQTEPSEQCLVDLYVAAFDTLKKDSDRDYWRIIWVEYLIRSDRLEEARAAAKDLSRADAALFAHALEGRSFVEAAAELLRSGGNPITIVDDAAKAGDKAALTALLSDPAIIPHLNIYHISALDLDGVQIDAAARQQLIDETCRTLSPPEYGDTILAPYKASHFVKAMDKLGARDTARTLVEKLEESWRRRLASQGPLNDLLTDGRLFARLYNDLGLVDRRNAVSATVLETALKAPDKGVSQLVEKCEDVCLSLTDAHLARLVELLERDRDGRRRAQLGLALIQTGRGELGERLLKGNEGTLTDLDLLQYLSRPGDYPRYLQLAQGINEPEAFVRAEILRLGWAKGKDRQDAINRLVTLIPQVRSPDQRYYYTQRALTEIPEPRDK